MKQLQENELNFHRSDVDSRSLGGSEDDYINNPYHSDGRARMTSGRDTGHFGSGTYFSTYRDYGYDSGFGYGDKYKELPKGKAFSKLEPNLFGADFDKYGNLYRVRSEMQGKLLMTALGDLNAMFNNIGGAFGYSKELSSFNNSLLYQRVKMNCDAIGLKCPSYRELSVMMRRFAEDGNTKSFSTHFMEWNGYNGVNVSGVPYFDRYLHGSVVYDLSKTSENPSVQPETNIGILTKDRGPLNTINNGEKALTPEETIGDSVRGDATEFSITELPSEKAMRALKNIVLNGRRINIEYIARKLGDVTADRIARFSMMNSNNRTQLESAGEWIYKSGNLQSLSIVPPNKIKHVLSGVFSAHEDAECWTNSDDELLAARNALLSIIAKFAVLPDGVEERFLRL